jgi:nitroreductase
MSDFLDIVRTRRSVRVYSQQPIDSDQVVELLKPALVAPTSKGKDSVEFVVVDDKETLERLSVVKPRFGTLIAGAALAVVVCGRIDMSDVWIEDASIASTMLLLSAENLNLGACWVQIRERNQANGLPAALAVKEILNLEAYQEPLCVVAFGHKAQNPSPHDMDHVKWERVKIMS